MNTRLKARVLWISCLLDSRKQKHPLVGPTEMSCWDVVVWLQITWLKKKSRSISRFFVLNNTSLKDLKALKQALIHPSICPRLSGKAKKTRSSDQKKKKWFLTPLVGDCQQRKGSKNILTSYGVKSNWIFLHFVRGGKALSSKCKNNSTNQIHLLLHELPFFAFYINFKTSLLISKKKKRKTGKHFIGITLKLYANLCRTDIF